MQQPYYKDLFESARCGILTIDESGCVTNLNHLGRQILDLPDPGPAKQPCQEFLRDYPTVQKVLLDSLTMKNPPSRIEIQVKAPGETRRFIGGTVSHIRRADGHRDGAVLFFRDLTHIEQGEEQERLKDRLAALGQMAAGLAHEIRNPLGNIGSTASVLKRKLTGSDSGILALDNIVQEVRRLNQTVTQCLEYAKPIHLRPHRVDLRGLITEALQEVRAKWPGNRVAVTESYSPDLPEVLADGIMLRQVFHNLIANAFDAMGGAGALEISGRAEPTGPPPATRFDAEGEEITPFAVIRFRDSGKGILPEARERLFFPFFTTKPGGSGIGLAVAKKIIDSHQGVIDVESVPGRGATFSVRIPCPRPDERA